jgi:RNA polymerase sigma factor (TIGR02999 family)
MAAELDSSNPVVVELYGELRRIAVSYLRRERSGHTLQPTALVHEAYLRLSSLNKIQWADRSVVLGIAAGIMRRILVDHARRKTALKRSAPPIEISLSSAAAEAHLCNALTLDAALRKMEQSYPMPAKLIELRFFGGLSEEESASFLGLSRATVQRYYTFARAWLLRELGGPSSR